MIIRDKLTITTRRATIAGMVGVALMVLMALEFNTGDAFATSYSYSITYNDSVVSDMPVDTTGRSESASVLLSSTSPTLSGYNFLGWCTTPPATDGSCSGTSYSAGSAYTLTSSSANNLTLYARWEEVGLTDLTGTTWYFNEIIPTSSYYYKMAEINFISGNTEYESLNIDICTPSTCGSRAIIQYEQISDYPGDGDALDIVYDTDDTGWSEEKYRTITIVDGQDTTSIDFIQWLSANATQL